jgi:hypothetical protein
MTFGAFRLVNETSGTPNATATDVASPFSQAINVPTNGALLAAGCCGGGGVQTTFTWTGATERFDHAVENNVNGIVDGASAASESGLALQVGRTVSYSPSSGTSGSMCLLTWG